MNLRVLGYSRTTTFLRVAGLLLMVQMASAILWVAFARADGASESACFDPAASYTMLVDSYAKVEDEQTALVCVMRIKEAIFDSNDRSEYVPRLRALGPALSGKPDRLDRLVLESLQPRWESQYLFRTFQSARERGVLMNNVGALTTVVGLSFVGVMNSARNPYLAPGYLSLLKEFFRFSSLTGLFVTQSALSKDRIIPPAPSEVLGLTAFSSSAFPEALMNRIQSDIRMTTLAGFAGAAVLLADGVGAGAGVARGVDLATVWSDVTPAGVAKSLILSGVIASALEQTARWIDRKASDWALRKELLEAARRPHDTQALLWAAYRLEAYRDLDWVLPVWNKEIEEAQIANDLSLTAKERAAKVYRLDSQLRAHLRRRSEQTGVTPDAGVEQYRKAYASASVAPASRRWLEQMNRRLVGELNAGQVADTSEGMLLQVLAAIETSSLSLAQKSLFRDALMARIEKALTRHQIVSDLRGDRRVAW